MTSTRNRWVTAAVFAVAGFLNSAPASAQSYTIQGLGFLDGGPYSEAFGLNANGQVVGLAYLTPTTYHAFLYSGGTMTDLGTFAGGGNSVAYGINNAGQVVGYAFTAGGNQNAFRYSGGTMTNLGALGGNTSLAQAINSSGQVVGYAFPGNGNSAAFLYSGGVMTNLEPAGTGGAAYGINDAGQVVGDVSNVPFIYSGGTFTYLPTFGGMFNIATAINAAGTQVVGFSNTAANGDTTQHAFLYSNGTLTNLGTFGDYDESSANAINDSGQIVGLCFSPNGGFGTNNAFIYEDGTLTNLNSLIPADSDWILEDATAINDSGQIAGYGIDPAGTAEAFLLTPTAVAPIPEPSTSILAIVGCAAALAWKGRSRLKPLRAKLPAIGN